MAVGKQSAQTIKDIMTALLAYTISHSPTVAAGTERYRVREKVKASGTTMAHQSQETPGRKLMTAIAKGVNAHSSLTYTALPVEVPGDTAPISNFFG